MPPLPTFYTFPKVADLAGCSRQAVHNAVRDGKLASITVAGHLLIEKEAAEIWIRD